MRAYLEAASDWADDMIGLLLPILLLALAVGGALLAALLVAVFVVKVLGGGGC